MSIMSLVEKLIVVIGFRNATTKPVQFDCTDLPENVKLHALRLGLSSMIRDAGAGEKSDDARMAAYRAKFDSMKAGEIGGRAPMSPEREIDKIGMEMVLKAIRAEGTPDLYKKTAAEVAKEANMTGAACAVLSTIRRMDGKATAALIKTVMAKARGVYDAKNESI